ncbi:DUF2809 domain-containing protein [Mucilaginibacter sp. dw_454]|uniref:ribosomal maturation YjgA family protein n=1 Tax=Mucilaginibacter sp. dw_454 TaxID=2720079 RepID=UPI001BD290D8|nr:DUF2809 domain-containing protein [Mucilaginibacter sp. dw_454]
MRFNLKYLLLTVALLAIEIIIARYVHDNIIRPFIGDFLVVILIHCLVMSFFKVNLMAAALGVLLFAYAVEISQYYHLVYVLGWGSSRFAKIIMGTSFSWTDMLMYTGGIILVVVIEMLSGKPLRINRKSYGVFH